jgi:antitoxin component of RelBE/YafQ-DinJ toxin-antitoxin module
MSRKIVSMQIRVTEDVRKRAKVVAKKQGLTLSELVLQLLANTGDKELKLLVNKELQERPKPGRPWDNNN